MFQIVDPVARYCWVKEIAEITERGTDSRSLWLFGLQPLPLLCVSLLHLPCLLLVPLLYLSHFGFTCILFG
jgi:hypothetical protein